MKVKDYFLTQKEFEIIENKEFGYLETFPIPKDLSIYYQSEDYISHSDGNSSLFERIYQLVKKYNLKYKFKKISISKTNFSLLDYGCGTGDFLRYVQLRGKSVFGIEPDEKALTLAQLKIGQENASNIRLSETSQKFDVITMWHVLEHVPNIMEFIPELKNKLKENGELLIAVPNFKSLDAQFYKSYWAAYDVPRHLWHFSPKSLENLFSEFGMMLDKKYPLWFDSYYICFLSEKYKKSKFGWMRATIIATLSNFLALFSGNYSSVIFRFRKEI